MTATSRVSLAAKARAVSALLSECQITHENAVVYSNLPKENPAFAEHMIRDIYVRRVSTLSAVTLIQLDRGAQLHGGGEFLLSSDDQLIEEQIPPYLLNDTARIEKMLGTSRPLNIVREEALLVARFGIYTWGHWLGELLPKIVITEARYPGRFRFVLPHDVATDAQEDQPWIRIRESLIAYGIDVSRIISIRQEQDYRFEQLFAVSSVWSDHLMHPDAAALMRFAVRLPDEIPNQDILLWRTGGGRRIANSEVVVRLLQQHGFVTHLVGRMPFREQVRLFRSARSVFGVLGSDLTGLLYASEGIHVISAAPAVFGDRFFYALILDRHGHYADLRGRVEAADPETPHRSSFVVDPDEIELALQALAA